MSSNRLPKRIVVCCDGTWYAADEANDSTPSNVARMSTSIARVGVDADGNPVPQVVFYHGGVGTGQLGPIDKIWQGAFGTGLNVNVCEAYYFIASNYARGDEIHLFGFSRGAFTARAVAGLICNVGLLKAWSLSRLHDMYEAYQTKGDGGLSATPWARKRSPTDSSKTVWDEFQQQVQRDVEVKVVGVWDTVGSLGLPDRSLLGKLTNWNSKYEFHDTSLHPKVENAFHALALDEHRGNFPPTMWYLGPDNDRTRLTQCWFPGYHADVGGGTASGKAVDGTAISDVAFAWMVDQVGAFLTMDDAALDSLFPRGSPVSAAGEPSRLESLQSRISWGIGRVTDSLTLGFWVAGGEFVRRPGEMVPKKGGQVVPRDRLREVVHPLIRYRVERVPDYRPVPLSEKEGWSFNDGADGKGRRWVKRSGPEELFYLKEYVIPAAANGGAVERKVAPGIAPFGTGRP